MSTENWIRQPGEWELQTRIWTAWPSHPEYWEGHIEEARENFLEFLKVLADGSIKHPVTVRVWYDGEPPTFMNSGKGILIESEHQPLGDIWFRDIAPIFVENVSLKQQETRQFRYNGWGEKYLMPNDDTVAERIAQKTGYPTRRCDWVFEGGSLDVNGAGIALTTAECLLNPNRNPHLTQKDIESRLAHDLGIQELIWLNHGLLNDHTDGHIDNIARFVSERKIVCMKASGADDPNAETYSSIYKVLTDYRDRNGEAFEVVQIPSPGKVLSDTAEIMPASYMNFLISNERLIVPIYGTLYDQSALKALGDALPGYEVVGVYAKGILYGGGSFHCITQQEY